MWCKRIYTVKYKSIKNYSNVIFIIIIIKINKLIIYLNSIIMLKSVSLIKKYYQRFQGSRRCRDDKMD